ncbi:hypothetical protein ACJIZ3_004592 [Penstemon smallii]|uniref:Bifunctional inhibitor/plant lipid transfer protein/seed storage helical domain-containing protein n=1 Tax=Penstemon smallii TaxID=265156 RepID=A0ABD3S2L7_9LAMI
MKPIISLMCILLALTISAGMATIEDDEKECAEELGSLAACIPYVSGSAKKPTKECCDETDKLRSAKPKCLCVLIKESTDPSLGLPINTTLALQMPAACHIDAKVSDCPTLLKLPADSPDAKIFKVVNADSSSGSTTNTPSNSTASSKSPSSSSTTTTSDTKPASSTSSSNNGAKTMSNILVGLGLVSVSWILV